MNIHRPSYLLIIFLSLLLPAKSAGQVVQEKGWLYYRYNWGIVFFPAKEHTTPTYENFFTAKKDTGYSFTGHYKAPELLMLAKAFPVDIEGIDDSIFVQPARVSFSTSKNETQHCDTLLNALAVFHLGKEEVLIYRSLGTCRDNEGLHFLNRKDKKEAKKRPRRTNIAIYPPH